MPAHSAGNELVTSLKPTEANSLSPHNSEESALCWHYTTNLTPFRSLVLHWGYRSESPVNPMIMLSLYSAGNSTRKGMSWTHTWNLPSYASKKLAKLTYFQLEISMYRNANAYVSSEAWRLWKKTITSITTVLCKMMSVIAELIACRTWLHQDVVGEKWSTRDSTQNPD